MKIYTSSDLSGDIGQQLHFYYHGATEGFAIIDGKGTPSCTKKWVIYFTGDLPYNGEVLRARVLCTTLTFASCSFFGAPAEAEGHPCGTLRLQSHSVAMLHQSRLAGIPNYFAILRTLMLYRTVEIDEIHGNPPSGTLLSRWLPQSFGSRRASCGGVHPARGSRSAANSRYQLGLRMNPERSGP